MKIQIWKKWNNFYLIENKCNLIFDYYEVDKDNLIIEME